LKAPNASAITSRSYSGLGVFVKLIVSTVCVLFFSVFAIAAKKNVTPELLLKETTEKYRKSALVELSVEKTLITDLNPAGQKHIGKIFLSAGLFRVENSEPEKSTLVFDGNYVWNEQPPSPDFPGPISVSRAKIDQKNKSQILFATLLTKEPITNQFKILKSSVEDSLTVFEAEPLQKDSNIKKLMIKIKTAKKEVVSISYTDEIGNKTEMAFTNTKLVSKKNPKLFKYKPPKGVQVTEL